MHDDAEADTSMPRDAMLVASPIKPQKVAIGYARKAKTVDVKLLKKSIWQELAPSGNEDAEDVVGNAGDDDKAAAVATDNRTGGAERRMAADRTHDFRSLIQV